MRKQIIIFDRKQFDDNHFEVRKRIGQALDDLNYLDKESLSIERVELLKNRAKKDLKEAIEYLDKFNEPFWFFFDCLQ